MYENMNEYKSEWGHLGMFAEHILEMVSTEVAMGQLVVSLRRHRRDQNPH